MAKSERPIYEEFLDTIKTEHEKSKYPGLDTVLQIMKNEIEPQIRRMNKPQLVEAFAEAIYSIYCTESWLNTKDVNIEHYRNEYLIWKLTAGHLQEELKITPAKVRKEASKKATDARHKESRSRANIIKSVWATGKYSNRDICAEQEYLGLGFNSFKAARNALKQTPDPSPWPAKKIKK